MSRALLRPNEAAALEMARYCVAELRDHSILGSLWLTEEGSRSFVVRMMKDWIAENPHLAIVVADWARKGSPLADLALRQSIVERYARGDDLPPYLLAYNMETTLTRHPVAPAKKKPDRVLRDVAIVSIVHSVCVKFGLKPTGRSARTQSGCSIVAKALGDANMEMGYDAVARIWGKYWRRCFPYFSAA